MRNPTARDLRPDRDLNGSRSDLPAPSRPGRPPGRDLPITRPQRAPCQMGTAQSFVGAPLAERIGRVVKAERPIRLDEATLRVREAAGVAHSSARTRKQMRLGAGDCAARPRKADAHGFRQRPGQEAAEARQRGGDPAAFAPQSVADRIRGAWRGSGTLPEGELRHRAPRRGA